VREEEEEEEEEEDNEDEDSLHFFSLHKHSSYKLKNNLQIFFNNFN
jgi:hypothetical protein